MKSFKSWAAVAWGTLAVSSFGLKAGHVSLDRLTRLPLCVFRFWTGIPCPGCGMTRALVAAFQGQWRLSFSYHPLGIPLLAVWTSWLLISPFYRLERPQRESLRKLRRWAEAVTLAVILIVYGVRLKQGRTFVSLEAFQESKG